MVSTPLKSSIQFRLALGLGVMLLPLIALGVTGFWSSQNTAKALENVLQIEQEELQPVQALQRLALLAAMPPNDYLILGESSERVEFDKLQHEVNAAFNALRHSKVASKSATRGLLDEAFLGWEKAQPIGQEILSIERPLGRTGASAQMKAFDAHIDQIADTLNRLYEKIREENIRLEIEARQLQHRATLFSSAIFLLAALTVLAVGLLVFRSVSTTIRERDQADHMLRQSEARFRLMADHAPVLIWISGPDKLCTYFNKVWLQFTGRTMEQELGNGWADGVHPEDLQRCLDIYTSHFNQRLQFNMDYRLRRADGVYRSVLDNGMPRFDAEGTFLGYIGSCIDITERKQAADALEQSEARYRAQFDLASEGIFTLSPEGVVLEVNAAFARMHGYTPAEMQNMNLKDLDTPASSSLAPARMRRLLAGEALTFEVEHLHRDGHAFPMEVSASLVHSGEKDTILCFHRDISERKQAEEAQHNLKAQLQQSQKMESLGVLAGGVAHDMNNVLGAILGLASTHIGTQPYGSPLHKALDTICKATERGGKMVKSLLSFARQSPAENHELDLNEIIREQVGLLERTILAKVRLQMNLETELRYMRGDASALSSAFMNLCVNAADAMPENGTLILHTRNIDNDWIEVVVEDNGTGMPKEVLEKALDPFFTTKPIGKGTGLGLSMVFSTVNAHRGLMTIQSDPGHGTRVVLSFPAFEKGAQVAAHMGSEATVTSLGALNVLVVDDDELIQSSIQGILEVLGHIAVSQAQSGEDALAMLEAGLEPDLVILDMNMPGLGGAMTLPRLRGLRPAVPVLLSTGRIDQTALTLASAHSGVTLLSKPFGLRELQQHLKNIGLG